MKLLPGLQVFDDVFDDVFQTPFFKNTSNTMKTDIRKNDGNYVLEMEVPGYRKEDIQIELNNGYLNISATTNNENEEKDTKGNIIRKERYSGSCSRNFYVGNQIKESDIHATYENGELKITIPDIEAKNIEEKKVITIE